MKWAPPLEQPRPAGWCDRLYRPPCWCPEEERPASDLSEWARRQVPNEGRSFEQARRRCHGDLQTSSDAALRREHVRAAVMLAFLPGGDPDVAWLTERLERIAQEMARRRRSTR